MGRGRFLSWPAGWRKASPWAVLLGLVAVGALLVLQALHSGWASLDRMFWCDTAIFFPFLVLGFTVLGARASGSQDRDRQPDR
jgi:hypothetical protein